MTFISHLSKSVNCRTGEVHCITHDWQFCKTSPDVKSGRDCWQKFVFDLFHVLLNGLLQILKRKLKEKHFCFIEKMIVQSVMLKKEKKNNNNNKNNSFDRYITEDKYAKKKFDLLICWSFYTKDKK